MERLKTPPRPLPPRPRPFLPSMPSLLDARRPIPRSESDGRRASRGSQPARCRRPAPASRPRTPRRVVAAAALIVLLAVAGAVGLWLRFRTGTGAAKAQIPARPPVSVLVADFDNRTGEAVFDDTLEPMFSVALEGASFLNTFNRRQARALASKLPNPNDKLDEQAARLIAVSEGIDVVLTGSSVVAVDGDRASVQALDGRTGKSVAAPEATVKTKEEVLRVIPTMVTPIRKALGDSTPRPPSSEKSAALSRPAHWKRCAWMRRRRTAVCGEDGGGLSVVQEGRGNRSGLARAYSGMAAMAQNLGRTQEAEHTSTWR